MILTGRYSGELKDIRVTGRAGGQQIALTIDDEHAAQHPALSQVWARRKIADMMDRMAGDGNEELRPAVLATALEYNLVSAYTSFLAVDASRRTSGSEGTTVQQALPVPEGVKYETTVDE